MQETEDIVTSLREYGAGFADGPGIFKEAADTIATLRAEVEGLRKAPDGFKWVCVKGLDPLLQALERADRKGYLPDAMVEEWNELEFAAIDAAKADKEGA